MSQSRSNVFWGHLFVALTGATLGLVVATQYVAHVLRYDRHLGQPWTSVAGVRLYAPWSWILWELKYERFAPAAFTRAHWIAYTGLFSTSLVLLLLAVLRSRHVKNSGAYGTARWAKLEDLDQAALRNDQGIVLCQTSDARFKIRPSKEKGTFELDARRHGRLIQHNGPEHALVFSPTRYGKGVGVVIPSLLSWTGSTIVWDLKRENWAATAGWRHGFSHCWRFEPTAPDSGVRYNPLLEVRRGDLEVRDAQVLADMLVDPSGEKMARDHWQTTGQILLTAGILHVLYAEEDKSLRGLARLFSDPAKAQYETLQHMLHCSHLPSGPHPLVAETAREMLNKSENELSGVLSTAQACLSLYRDPLIARATSTSDFRIADLMNADAPVSLYLVIPPGDIDRTKPLIRLMLNQIGRRLTEKMGPKPGQDAYKHRLLFLIDEFPSLGHLAFFDSAIAHIAGYGIKCLLICQSLRQLEKYYGPNNGIIDNSHLKLTYSALDDLTAERVSKLLGTATEQRRQVNYGGNRLSPWLGHVTNTDQELARPLLTPGEVLQLPFDQALLITGAIPPYRGKKVVYYQDPRFKDRAHLPTPDSPAEQARELIPGAPVSDWLTLPRPQPAASTPTSASTVPLLPPERQLNLETEETKAPPVQQETATSPPTVLTEARPPAPVVVAPPSTPFDQLWNDFLPPPPAGTDPAAVEHEEATTAASDEHHHHSTRRKPDRDIPL